jgi:hypothetical protein
MTKIDPLGIRPCEFTADHFSKTIRGWGLNAAQISCLQILMEDIYMDGWSDGVAHRTNLTPKEHKERLIQDLKDSWMRLIILDRSVAT